MRLTTPLVPSLLLASLALGCKDSTTGPSVDFPDLPAAMQAAFCVQGNRAPGQAIGGTLATTDCDFGDGTFFETWRLRVATTGSYRLAASSTFDNLLFLGRLDSIVGTTAYITDVGNDDDSGDGTNALIATASLSAGVDYFVAVNGFDLSDVGPYSVTFTKN